MGDQAQLATAGPVVDPITFSVILNRLNSIAKEMTIALENAAMTSIIGLCRDYSCVIYDGHARQVAMVDAIPIHTNSMHLVLGHIVSDFADDIAEGDVFMCNYPYSGGTHIGDLVTACPVYFEGEHVFWAAAKGHQLDVGAPVPTSANPFAQNVWQEGIQIPPVKIYQAGSERRDVVNFYLTNLRWRQALHGDLMAQLGSIWTAERRLHELCTEFGVESVKTYVNELIAYAARRTKDAIQEIPNGVYRGEGWLDADLDRRDLPIRCRVTVSDESVEVDFAGSAPQSRGSSNATNAVLQAAGGIPVIMTLDPDIPHNEGCLRCVTVSAPLGSICNAEYPAATAAATTLPGDVMQDAVCRALAHAIPDKIRAGSAHWSNIPVCSGTDPRNGEPWGHAVLNGGSGGGAAHGADGWPLITTNAAHGGLKTASVEHTELLYPLHIEDWEIEPGSMGLGEYIGGPGVRVTVLPTGADVEMVFVCDGLTNPPFGLCGGSPGRGGGSFVVGSDGRRYFLPSTPHFTLSPGEAWVGVSTGGGGCGDPLDRSVDRVREDVRDGLYSRDLAAEIYGVVLSDEADPVIDEEATVTRRRLLQRQRDREPLPVVVPTRPRASSWTTDTMRDGDVLIDDIANAARVTN
jgi:N-methylhydantoinase B